MCNTVKSTTPGFHCINFPGYKEGTLLLVDSSTLSVFYFLLFFLLCGAECCVVVVACNHFYCFFLPSVYPCVISIRMDTCDL